MFTAHTKTETLASFDTLEAANAYAIETAKPNSGVAMTMPQGGQMSLWDFRVWSTMSLRRLARV